MKNITIYSRSYCPHCMSAKKILRTKGLFYTEIDVSKSPEKRQTMTQLSGQRSVPQIFFGDRFIGGAKDLEAFFSKSLSDNL